MPKLSRKKFLILIYLSLLTLTPGLTSSLSTTKGVLVSKARAQSIPAFPGAEGFGAQTIGGRGGQVIEVTNLSDGGSGSLRACAEASGPRICVFKIGGTIDIRDEIRIENPYITIAGMSAPGDGILIKRSGINIRTHDIVIRGIRIRVGDESSDQDPEARDSLKIEGGSDPKHNIIIDHSSFSWAIDEVVSTWGDTDPPTLSVWIS